MVVSPMHSSGYHGSCVRSVGDNVLAVHLYGFNDFERNDLTNFGVGGIDGVDQPEFYQCTITILRGSGMWD